MEFLIVLAVLSVVVVFVTGPLRPKEPARAPQRRRPGAERGAALAELEAARDAKYRELRDAELDHRTGKLSDADFEAIDQTLRAEAVAILHELDRALSPKP
jgi:hypothetical protein